MARISAARKAKFPEPDLEDFVVAGSERSCEVLGPYKCEEPTCVVCGARLRDVFVTNYGPMGGDCFSTLSGDPTTRKAYRKLVKLFDQVEAWGATQWSLWGHQIMYMKIEVSPAHHSQGNLVWVKFHQYDPESMREYDRRVGHVPEQPGVVEYLRGWAADHHIKVMEEGVWRDNPVRVLTKSQYEQRMAQGGSGPEFPPAKAAALERLVSNDEQGFLDWMNEQYDEQTVQESLNDPQTRLDEIRDWASQACDVEVTDDGYVQFDELRSDDECDTQEAVGGLPVLVYHHTTSGALKGIREHRGLVSGQTLGYEPTEHNSADYVFVTTRRSGPEINGYVWRARQRFGGDHVILTIKTTLYELEPDPDDADLSTGRTQFVLDRVGIDDIVEVWPPRYEKMLRPKQKTTSPRTTKGKRSKLPPGSKYISGPTRKQNPTTPDYSYEPREFGAPTLHGKAAIDQWKRDVEGFILGELRQGSLRYAPTVKSRQLADGASWEFELRRGGRPVDRAYVGRAVRSILKRLESQGKVIGLADGYWSEAQENPVASELGLGDLWHGTNPKAWRSIARTGMLVREVPQGKYGKAGRKVAASLKDRVYVSTDPFYAAIYAIGGMYFGTKLPRDRWKGSRYGYLVRVIPEARANVVLDEDQLGELAVSGKLPWLTRIAERVGSRVRVRSAFANTLWQAAQQGEYSAWIRLGKLLIENLTDDQMRQAAQHATQFAISGNVRVVEAWRIDKTKTESMRTNDPKTLFSVAEKVYPKATKQNPVRACGFEGEAWENNPLIDLPDDETRPLAEQIVDALLEASDVVVAQARSDRLRDPFKDQRFQVERRFEYELEAKTADGMPVTVPIVVDASLESLDYPVFRFRSVRGMFSPSDGRIRMRIQGAKDYDFDQRTREALVDRVEANLRHELTHALDPSLRFGAKRTYDADAVRRTGSMKSKKDLGYLDDPLEVRAFAREVVDTVLRSARRRGGITREQLAKASAFDDKRKPAFHMSEANKNKLRREIYRALKSEGLIIESNPVRNRGFVRR
jgi:hypothetical protein